MTPSAVSWSLPPGPTQPVTNTPSRIPLHAEMLGTPQPSPYITATLSQAPLGAISSETRLPQHSPPLVHGRPVSIGPTHHLHLASRPKGQPAAQQSSSQTRKRRWTQKSREARVHSSIVDAKVWEQAFSIASPYTQKNNQGELGLRDPSSRWCEDPTAGGPPVLRGCL